MLGEGYGDGLGQYAGAVVVGHVPPGTVVLGQVGPGRLVVGAVVTGPPPSGVVGVVVVVVGADPSATVKKRACGGATRPDVPSVDSASTTNA